MSDLVGERWGLAAVDGFRGEGFAAIFSASDNFREHLSVVLGSCRTGGLHGHEIAECRAHVSACLFS